MPDSDGTLCTDCWKADRLDHMNVESWKCRAVSSSVFNTASSNVSGPVGSEPCANALTVLLWLLLSCLGCIQQWCDACACMLHWLVNSARCLFCILVFGIVACDRFFPHPPTHPLCSTHCCISRRLFSD